MRHRAPSQRLADDVAPTLDHLARTTAGGQTLRLALDGLPDSPGRPFAALLRNALSAPQQARPLHERLAAFTNDRLGTEAALALSTLELLARHGGPAPSTLDRAASAVRERRAAVAERRAQSAQARLSALVLSALPIAFCGWSLRADPRTAQFLLHTTTGLFCLAGGLVLNGLGWFWMRRLVGDTR